MITDVQVTPPSTDRYMRFCRVLRPPPPSSMAAMKTVLLNLALTGGGPGGVPVTCTSRRKPEESCAAELQVLPSSEWVTERAPPFTLKLLKETYMRPYAALNGLLSTHIDGRSSAELLWAQDPVVQFWPSGEVQRPIP